MLEEWTARRRWVARQYNIQFSDTEIKAQRIPADYKHVYHIYVIQVDKRDELKTFLEKRGIQTQIHYPKPLNQLKIFKDQRKQKVSDAISGRLLSLPMYPEMSQEQIMYVADNVRKFITYGG
jgi:dTDP-4-amino-4,6-dideoxygalactose transaminase